MYGFKSLLVEPTQDEDQAYMKYRQKRRANGAISEDAEIVDEALTTQQRLKRSRQMKRYQSRINMGRQRAMRRTADKGRIERRAQKHARMQLFKKLSKGKSPAELSMARRREIETRLAKMKPRIDRIAKKMVPQIRKIEKDRRQK